MVWGWVWVWVVWVWMDGLGAYVRLTSSSMRRAGWIWGRGLFWGTVAISRPARLDDEGAEDAGCVWPVACVCLVWVERGFGWIEEWGCCGRARS